MKISVSQIRYNILCAMIFYVLNKNLWDWLLGGVAKNIYYCVVAIGAILCVVQYLKNKYFRNIFILFLIYCMAVVFNGFTLANSEQLSVGFIEYITYPLSFFALLYFLKDKIIYTKLFNALMKWASLTSVLAIYEFIVRKSILPEFEGRVYTFDNGSSSYRSTVFIGSPMMLGVVLGAIFIITVYSFYTQKKNIYKIYIALELVGILCTGSRGPLIGSLLGVVFMYYYFYKQNGIKRNSFLAIVILVFATIMLLIVMMAFPNFSTGIEAIDFMIYRVTSALNFSTEWGNVERLSRWTYYINRFLKKPITGYGIATTSAAVKSNSMVTLHGITTESGLLARLVETGLLGTISYFCFLARTIRCGCKETIKQDETIIFVLGIVVLFMIEDIILQISLDLFCTFILWFALAYAVNMKLNNKKQAMNA